MRPKLIVIFVSVFAVFSSVAVAVSPVSVAQGRQLFERNWTARNPQLGGDGLGPLFNGQSCVACHHQGGVGGSGDSRFNALTLGIESMKITGGPVDNDVIAGIVRAFHPGFISTDGTMTNTLVLSHHGGSPMFQSARAEILSQIDSLFSGEGGPSESAEVRRAYATPILFQQKVGRYNVLIRARLFQRNTTSMFGSGLIDNITGQQIEAQAKLQKQHPEISGRPATLKSGRYGKFGWRGNIASLLDFVDQACAAEVGLETTRKKQPLDPTTPDYRNTTTDIKDDQIIAMRDFLAALPRPTRELPVDSQRLAEVNRGEQLFASVGCSICHVPNMGPAEGIYSDILLHDMGYPSIDLNPAEPYIVRTTPESRVVAVDVVSRTKGMGTYYGGSAEISVDRVERIRGSASGRESRSNSVQRYFEFSAPTRPLVRSEVVKLRSETFEAKTEQQVQRDGAFRGSFTKTTEGVFRRDDYVRLTYEPTQFNQEWRTPPLWGLRDSAPYMHDGRAETVLEAIAMHDGESAGTRDRFLQLPLADRHAVLAFLDTLVAPPTAPQQSD